MKERPILFNTAMVQAILAGRKTQTRRLLKPCKDANFNCELALHEIAGEINAGDFSNSKVGQPGDRLWVRETWSVVSHSFSDDGQLIDWDPDRPAIKVHEMPFGNGYYSGHAIYAADGYFQWGDEDGDETDRSHWKPSIHMPRWACRIILEITGLHVERLQNISDSDAMAEGIQPFYGQGDAPKCFGIKAEYCGFGTAGSWNFCSTPVEAFKQLWYSTGGQWNANPWVWVIEFKVLTTNGMVPEVAA